MSSAEGPGPTPPPGPPDRPAGQQTGLDRLRGSLLRPSRAQAVVAVVLALVGFAAVTQAHETNSDDTYSGLRQSELIQALNGLSAASRRAENDISDLRDTRDSLQSSTERRAAALEQARKEVATLGILAGTLPATGTGIRITIRDQKRQLTTNHLLDGIEELRDAGAEAMEINDSVRVIAQTSFQDGEGGIEVDGKLLTAPYTIDVIGDADSLAKALDFPGGFKDEVGLDDGVVTTEKHHTIKVTVTRKPVEPRYAESVGGQ